MWRTILVPHDFSPCADRALDLAVQLARHHGSEVVLAHISPLSPNVPAEAMITPPGSGKPTRLADFIAEEVTQRLEGVAARARSTCDARIRTISIVSSFGEVVEELLALARQERAGLFVLGTHGRTGLSHLFIGSVAERLVRRSPVPVLTVRVPAPDVVPTDGEQLAEDETVG